jgi:hypothetical protein
MTIEKERTTNNGESFWGKYKKFAMNEILLYLIMVVGIVVGLLVLT